MLRGLAQIFVEIERARLTRKLAAMKEAEGNIAEAADILQEVAVVSGMELYQPWRYVLLDVTVHAAWWLVRRLATCDEHGCA